MNVFTEIYTLNQAREFFKHSNSTLNLKKFINDVCSGDPWIEFSSAEEKIKGKLQEAYQNIADDSNLKLSFECLIFNKLHNPLMSLLHEELQKEDARIFEKSIELCEENVTAEQLGAPEDYAVPLLAPVVELSSLDNHKSHLEKFYCLCTTYDMIFAELKIHFITAISTYSDNQIPVINNDDIIPILMMVIIRSKLLHLASNIYYIDTFLNSMQGHTNFRHILKSYKQAIENIKNTNKKSLKPGCEKVCRDLDLVNVIKLTSKMNTRLFDDKITPLDGHFMRITDLIVSSTNENHPVS